MTAEIKEILSKVTDVGVWPERECVIYGAGNFGRIAGRAILDSGSEVCAYIDERADEERVINGRPCFLPDDVRVVEMAGKEVPVLVAIFNFATDISMVVKKLREAGFKKILNAGDFLEKYPDSGLRRYWHMPCGEIAAYEEELNEVFELWDDQLSRDIFLDILRARVTGAWAWFGKPDRERQYFPAGLPGLNEPIAMVDGGAYTGDTLEAMSNHGCLFDRVAAFEPDSRNFKKLRETLSQWSGPQVRLFQKGLGEKSQVCHFSGGQGAASRLVTDGEEVEVEVVSLDEVLPDFLPTFIKLDIEGAEPSALRGAENMIREACPRLAVCIYHEPGHLWELPKQMKKLLPKSRLYLRSHGYNGFDSVAYAIPEHHF